MMNAQNTTNVDQVASQRGIDLTAAQAATVARELHLSGETSPDFDIVALIDDLDSDAPRYAELLDDANNGAISLYVAANTEPVVIDRFGEIL